jgi:hypothetical protein
MDTRVKAPQIIFLNTNIYIIGIQSPDSDEAGILQAIGYYGDRIPLIDLIFHTRLILKFMSYALGIPWN